jgi:hypothetical protein
LTTVCNAAMNMVCGYLFEIVIFISFDCYPEVGSLSYMVVTSLIFKNVFLMDKNYIYIFVVYSMMFDICNYYGIGKQS